MTLIVGSYDLSAMATRKGRNAPAQLRPIQTTKAQAQSLGKIYLGPVQAWSQALRENVLPAYHARDTNPQQLETDLARARDTGTRKALSAAGATGLGLWLSQVSIWHVGFFQRTVKAATDIDIGPLVSTHDATAIIEVAQQRNGALLQSVADDIANRATNITWSGVRAGLTEQQVVQQFNAALQIVQRRAINIGIDQTVKFSADLDLFRATQAGLGEYMWHHVTEDHPRLNHLARNGKVYSWAHPPADGNPGTLPFCRCVGASLVGFTRQ